MHKKFTILVFKKIHANWKTLHKYNKGIFYYHISVKKQALMRHGGPNRSNNQKYFVIFPTSNIVKQGLFIFYSLLPYLTLT